MSSIPCAVILLVIASSSNAQVAVERARLGKPLQLTLGPNVTVWQRVIAAGTQKIYKCLWQQPAIGDVVGRDGRTCDTWMDENDEYPELDGIVDANGNLYFSNFTAYDLGSYQSPDMAIRYLSANVAVDGPEIEVIEWK